MSVESEQISTEQGLGRFRGAVESFKGLARRWRDTGEDIAQAFRGRSARVEVHSVIPSHVVDAAYLAELHAVSTYDYGPHEVADGVADRFDAALQLRRILPKGTYLLVVKSEGDLSAMVGKERLRGVISLATSQDSQRQIRQRASGGV